MKILYFFASGSKNIPFTRLYFYKIWIFFENPNNHLYQLFNACHHAKFRNEQTQTKLQICWFWAQKWPIYNILSIIWIFLKIQNNHFYSLINACQQVWFLKNLMKRFRKKLSCVDFRPKNDLFLAFLRIIRIFHKNPKQSVLPIITVIRYYFRNI